MDYGSLKDSEDEQKALEGEQRYPDPLEEPQGSQEPVEGEQRSDEEELEPGRKPARRVTEKAGGQRQKWLIPAVLILALLFVCGGIGLVRVAGDVFGGDRTASAASATVVVPAVQPTKQSVLPTKVALMEPTKVSPKPTAEVAANLQDASKAPAEISVVPGADLLQVALFSQWVDFGGSQWELPMGTHYAATTANGRYEAVESAPAGKVNGTDYGWCGQSQYDCPPHAFLLQVEAPSCVTAVMDVSYRIIFTNQCGPDAKVTLRIRENDVTRSGDQVLQDYLTLAALTSKAPGVKSEVGFFFSVEKTGTSSLEYNGEEYGFGYGCFDCLPDTTGKAGPVPVRLDDPSVEHFGNEGTSPAGSSRLPAVVFPWGRPGENPKEFNVSLSVATEPVVFWVGRYDVK